MATTKNISWATVTPEYIAKQSDDSLFDLLKKAEQTKVEADVAQAFIVVFLVDTKGWSAKDIGAKTDISETTITRYLARGKVLAGLEPDAHRLAWPQVVRLGSKALANLLDDFATIQSKADRAQHLTRTSVRDLVLDRVAKPEDADRLTDVIMAAGKYAPKAAAAHISPAALEVGIALKPKAKRERDENAPADSAPTFSAALRAMKAAETAMQAAISDRLAGADGEDTLTITPEEANQLALVADIARDILVRLEEMADAVRVRQPVTAE